MYGFAKAICNAAFISPIVRGDEASVFYLVSMAEDLGAQWTHGLRSIYPLVKRGRDGEGDQIRAGIQGDLALALLLGRRFRVKIKESTPESCTVWMSRPDGEMEFEDSFTYEEAKAAGLTGKPNWNYRKDMLRWRAIMRVGRVVGADVLGGMYLPDEIEEFGVSERTPEKSAPENDDPFEVSAEPIQKSNTGQSAPADTVRQESVAAPEPPKAEERQRGRRQSGALREELGKALDPQAAGDAGQPAQDKPNGATQGFRATEEDLPSNMHSMPAPAKPAEPSQQDRMKAITDKITYESKRTRESVTDALKEYLRAFWSVGRLYAFPNPKYEEVIPILAALATSQERCAELLRDPHGLGVRGAAGWGKLVRFAEGLPKAARETAIPLAVAKWPEDGGGDLVAYLENVVGISKLAPADIITFLWVYRITNSAMKLKDLSDETKIPMNQIAASWDLDLDKCSERDVLTAIAKGVVVAGEEPKDLFGE
jgi:hypothetical protein